ncbi:e3 ubiquitin-protein ligase [Nannochloropsis gaditana]|uniref:HECT-type E3 ubiquitin transferase n=1 Tax=Nannochloropsis gaditana TaxID=72520 RepID=W7U4Y4_9STRA|nr:e3 ubiquitin-protein ligase [Nannochloropsis gaditana]
MPSSPINPDHLAHFRFVGRVLGKALSDDHLLDAHFTRSFYKHILGAAVTHRDMEGRERGEEREEDAIRR